MKPRLVLALAISLLAPLAAADVVHLRDGRKIEGTVIEQTASKVVVRTKLAVVEFPAADVARIEKGETPEQEFSRRLEEARGDAKALFDLYLWAKGKGLRSLATKALREVVKADPDHEAARRLLGYERWNGRWVTKREKERLASEAERRQKEAQGLVEYKGRWVTPEEKERLENEAKGLVLVDGKWVDRKQVEKAEEEARRRREREEKRAQGLFEIAPDKWVPRAEAEAWFADLNHPYPARGERVILYTNKGIDFGEKMLVGAEAAYRDAKALLGAEPPSDAGPLHVFCVSTLKDYNRLGADWNADEQSSNFYAFTTPWLPENEAGLDVVSVTQFNKTDSLTEIYVRHATVENFVMKLVGPEAGDPPPRWFVNGVAAYLSRFSSPKLLGWSRERLLTLGGVPKLSTLFKSYLPTEQNILSMGYVIAWIRSGKAPDKVVEAWDEAVAAVREGKRVAKAFRKLEKELAKADDDFRDFAGL